MCQRQYESYLHLSPTHIVEMVRIKNPKVIVAENVIGIKTLGDGAVFDKISLFRFLDIYLEENDA